MRFAILFINILPLIARFIIYDGITLCLNYFNLYANFIDRTEHRFQLFINFPIGEVINGYAVPE